MEHDDNYMETDSRKELKSPTEVLNNPESSEQIPSPAAASGKPESFEVKIPSPAEASDNPESSEVKIPSPAEASYKPESSELKIPSPVEASDKPESSELKIPSHVEASNKPESSELKIPSPVEASDKPDSSELKILSFAEASDQPESSELKIPSSAEAFSGPESAEKEMSSTAEAAYKPDSSEKKTPSAAEASNARKKTPKSLKGKSKIMKKPPPDNNLKSSKAIGGSQTHGRKRRRDRGNREGINKRAENSKKLNSRKDNQQNITNEEHTEKSNQAQKDQGKIDELRKSQQKQKNTEKRHGSDKGVKSQKNREKHDEKSEKLGGMIFMCSGKTKPDCFNYCIMGVSMGKKDLVLGIRPGLKLFLYDFDLKLLYGVYKASSSGGLKIEPKAFGGAFPAQVRFNVEKDCLPLPESVFRKAIKENYNEKNKFKTELTVRQVRKLTALFRPAQVHSTALPTRSPLGAKNRDRGIHEGVRESLPHAHRDPHARDPYANGDARAYPVLSHERDQHVAYRDVVPVRREENRDLYLTEKEYRAYGLQGERRNLAPHIITPALEAHHREYEREHLLRQTNLIYREAVPAHREAVHSDPLYLNEKEYPAYSLAARRELPPETSATAVDVYARDPYYGYHYGSSSDPYLALQRREDACSGSYSVGGRRESYLIERDPLQRRESDRTERLYSTYSAAEAALGYNPSLNQGAKPEAVPAPVSSRYAFAGPSYSYR